MASGTDAPRRWLVVGGSGAGKTHFSIELGRILDLPVIHLDRHYWGPGWTEPSRETWRERTTALSARPEWVMDGNYGGTLGLRLARAEAVVMLDPPTWQCVWGIYRRGLRAHREARPDLADGCPERLPSRAFLTYVLSYKRSARGRALAKIEAAPHARFEHLKGRREVARWLSTVEGSTRRHI